MQNKLEKLTEQFLSLLKKRFSDKIILNGHPRDRLPNTLNVSFKGFRGNDILEKLQGVAASTGSACHSENEEPSSVLKAMGVERELALGAIRFSLGRYTTIKELKKVVAKLEEIIN
ncbi:MAG: aminotransferase class V-fold PLP-dependent enzyme [Bacillota bacterium]